MGYKMGNIDCLGKPSDKKTRTLLFSESDKLKTSNIGDKSREELLSNLRNIDNEKKMECDISSDQVKPKRRGRPKKERSQDSTEELEEKGNEGIHEKMEIQAEHVEDHKEIKHGKLSGNDFSNKEKPTVEDEEKVNTVSKRERGIEVKNMDEEINKVQSIYSPKLKKRKASEESGTETDKQADKTDLGCKTDTLSSVKEQSSVEIGSKSINEKDMKKEKE